MTLHISKKTAILQLCNSLSSLDLQNIQQLTSFEYFCDLISYVEVNPECKLAEGPSALNRKSLGEKNTANALQNDTEELPTDDEKALNDKTFPVENNTPESKEKSENIKHETRRSKRRSSTKNTVDSLSILSPEIPKSAPEIISNSALDVPNSALDVPNSALNVPNSALDAPNFPELPTDLKVDEKVLDDKTFPVENNTPESKEKSENIKHETRRSKRRSSTKNNVDSLSILSSEIPKSAEIISNSAIDVPNAALDAPNFPDDNTERYSFIKKFIDDTYIIESNKIIMYSLCLKSDELELAKVAVLILSAVVRHYLSSKRGVLSTLALLDLDVQEDIQELLSLFLLQDKKVTKEEIENVLTKPAQYKRSPRSHRFATTPRRSCSSRYKKSVSAITPPAEDIFSDSPLKSLFESPQFQNRELLTKELAKTRKLFLAEEQRSEDLVLEVNSLKKKLENRDKENKALKEKIKNIRLKEEMNRCKTCESTKIKLDNAMTLIKQQKEEIKDRENAHEKELSKFTSIITILRAKLNNKINQVAQSMNPASEYALRNKEREVDYLKHRNKILEDQMEELKKEFSANKSLLQEKKSQENAAIPEPPTPVVGECLGSVIEEDNRELQNKLFKVKSMLENLLNQKCVNSQGVGIINEILHIFAKNKSDLSMPILMDTSDVSETRMETNTDAEIGRNDAPIFMNNSNFTGAAMDNRDTLSISNVAETTKDVPILLNDRNKSNVEIDNKYALPLSSDCSLNNAAVGNKEMPSLSKDCNLKNNAGIDHKDALSLSSNSKLNDVEVHNNDTPNLSNNYDATNVVPDMNESEQTYDCRLQERKSNAVSQGENIPVLNTGIGSLWSRFNDYDSKSESSAGVMPNVNEQTHCILQERDSNAVSEGENIPVSDTGVGSLWSRYNDSGSESESSAGVSFSNNAVCLSKQDLLKQLGFSEAEYSAKLNIAKKLWALFKELFITNGSNGFVGCNFKSEFDYIVCLLPIKEYLFRFQNNNLISKNYELLDKIVCNCDNTYVKELEEIKMKMSKSEAYALSYIEQKDAEIEELRSKLDAMEQKCQDVVRTNKDFHSKNKILLQKHEDLKNKMVRMMNKVSEADQLRNQCANLLNEKNETEQLHKKRLKLCRDKIIGLDIQKREFQVAVEKEKKVQREMAYQIQSLKSEVMSLKTNRKYYEKCMKDLKTECMRLGLLLEEMKEKEAHTLKNVISCTIPVHHNTRPEFDKNSEININVKVQDVNSHKTASAHETSVRSSNYPSKLTSLDASSISSFNKSMHGMALINDDEEEYSFQGGSLEEIKKEYDSSALKERRITELHRRNTMCLPHMQSSYPIELQSLSPYSQKLLEPLEKPNKAAEKKEVPSSSGTNCDPALKKRKVEEVEPECKAGPSQLHETPLKTYKHFKAPSSLRKLIRHRINRRPHPKPKS